MRPRRRIIPLTRRRSRRDYSGKCVTHVRPVAEIKEDRRFVKRNDLQCYKCRGTAVCLFWPPPPRRHPPPLTTPAAACRLFHRSWNVSLLLSVFSSPYSSPFLGRWPPLSESAFANHHPHLVPPQAPSPSNGSTRRQERTHVYCH